MYWKTVHRHCSEIQWKWPAQYRPSYLAGLFNEAKKAASEKAEPKRYKGSCAEVMTAMPLLVHFIESLQDRNPNALAPLAPAIRSLTALNKVVRELFRPYSVPVTGASSADEVETLIVAHFDAHVDAYGEGFVKPKVHHGTHLPEQWRRLARVLVKDGVAIWMNCLVHERKHQSAKRS